MTDAYRARGLRRFGKMLQSVRRPLRPSLSQSRANLLAATVLVVTALQLVRGRLYTGLFLAHDVYAYYFPNMLYAVRQLHAGGQGLLWNPLQNCGQPFLANALIGLFYPPNWMFTVLDPDNALPAVLLANAAIAALGSYALFRQFEVAPIPALAGALAFLVGPTTLTMTAWSPMHIGSYCWLPVALLFAERLLTNPTASRGVALGMALTFAILPGYPQMTLFIYLMVGLRVVVQIATGGETRILQTLGTVAAALVLPILLGAVSVFPYVEFWQESVRSRVLAVAASDWTEGANVGIDRLLVQDWRVHISAVLGLIAFGVRRFRRPALFFFLAGGAAVAVALGPSGPLGSLYSAIPGANFFRRPDRFLWLTDICCAGLVALGLDAMGRALRASDRGSSWARGSAQSLLRIIVVVVLPATVVWSLQRWEDPVQKIARSSKPFLEYEPSFRPLRARMTPQDRAYLAHLHPLASEFRFMHKSASLFEVPSVFDYEPMTNRRYADFFVMMQTGRTLERLDQLIYSEILGWFPRGFHRRMLSLVGARYVVLDRLDSPSVPKSWLRPVPESGSSDHLRIYENSEALPRAFIVGGVNVVSDPAQLLLRLANGPDPPTEVALVEEPPVSRFLGAGEQARRDAVEFVVDDPEHLVLKVNAPWRGFLFLSDTYYPGWTAEVNGAPVPIQRANYAFRLVEVPQGRSTVRFRFRPTSLLVGAGVSLGTIVFILAALFGSRLRNRRIASHSLVEIR